MTGHRDEQQGEPRFPKAWYDKRRPCWICSRPLATVTTGEHKGMYAAVLVKDAAGISHPAHEICAYLETP